MTLLFVVLILNRTHAEISGSCNRLTNDDVLVEPTVSIVCFPLLARYSFLQLPFACLTSVIHLASYKNQQQLLIYYLFIKILCQHIPMFVMSPTLSQMRLPRYDLSAFLILETISRILRNIQSYARDSMNDSVGPSIGPTVVRLVLHTVGIQSKTLSNLQYRLYAFPQATDAVGYTKFLGAHMYL